MHFDRDLLTQIAPSLFPVNAYIAFGSAADELVPYGSDQFRDFGGAMNGILYRFRACAKYKEDLCKSWRLYGPNVWFNEIMAREGDLFGFFACAIASVESTSYAVYVASTRLFPDHLSYSESARKYKSTPEKLVEELRRVSSSSQLVQVLDYLKNSTLWKSWKNYRNTMSHRSVPPRIVRATAGGPPPVAFMLDYDATWSTEELQADEKDMDNWIRWLSSMIESLMVSWVELREDNNVR